MPLGQDLKLPDCAWSVDLDQLPNQGQGHNFVQIPNQRMFSPIIAAEIAISNESLVQLATRDVARYFQAGTGTRWWIGVKVFRADPPRVTRWWAGHALRDFDAQNNVWRNTFTFCQNSMDRDLAANAPLTTSVAGLRFSADVNYLLQPVGPPAGYPTHLHFDMERIRLRLVACL